MKKTTTEAPPSSSVQTPEAGSPGSPLTDRANEAIRRITSGIAPMRIPADPCDADRVIADLLAERDEARAEVERLLEFNASQRKLWSQVNHDQQTLLEQRDAASKQVARLRAALEEIAAHYGGAATKRDIAREALAKCGQP